MPLMKVHYKSLKTKNIPNDNVFIIKEKKDTRRIKSTIRILKP